MYGSKHQHNPTDCGTLQCHIRDE